jgi:Tfp pilus assembly protein PilN
LRELADFAGSGAQVVGLIGRSHAVLRDLRLPDAPPHELPGMVQLQAIRELSFPVEQAAIDYEVVGAPDSDGQRRVILAALQQDVIDRFRRSIQNSGLEPSRVGLRPYATWRAYRAVNSGSSAATLVVALAGESLELTVGQGDCVLFSRATLLRATGESKGEKFDPAPALLSEVRRTLAAFGNQVPGVLVDRVVLAAGAQEHQSNSAVLADGGLGVPVERFDPFAAVELSREARQSLAELGGERGVYVGAVGAAVSAHEMWPIDFLNPKRPVVLRDRRKPLAMLAAAAAVLLVAGSYAVVQLQLANGRQKIAELTRTNSKLQDQLKDASEFMRKYQAVDQWKRLGVNDLTVLERLTEEHPVTKEMHVTSLRIERDRSPTSSSTKIVLDGLARQQVTVSEFNTKLNDGQNFSARPAGMTQPQKNNRSYPFSFKSEITEKRELAIDGTEVPAATQVVRDAAPSTRNVPRRKSDLPGEGQARKPK